MKTVWLTAFLILILSNVNAQNLLEGQVIDRVSKESIPAVTVTLIKAKISAQTNSMGYFKIESDNSLSGDTVVFSHVGYVTFRMPVSAYQGNSLILLQPSNATLDQVNITNSKLKILRLNEFDFSKIKKGQGYVPQPFTAQSAYAKLFEAPEENALLTKVELGRTVFHDPQYPQLPLVKYNPRTRFLLHIMSVHSDSKMPDKTLFTKTVSLDDNGIWVTIDLSKDNIVLDRKEFFVAVEWLRIPYNEVFKLEWAPRVKAVKKNGTELLEDVSMYQTLYQPALVSYEGKKDDRSYIKYKRGKWILYPGRDVALSATIKY
ncbi:MAG: carboxypeptidase-like regulatory domain-containing protein [Bacteroidota bacterium]